MFSFASNLGGTLTTFSTEELHNMISRPLMLRRIDLGYSSEEFSTLAGIELKDLLAIESGRLTLHARTQYVEALNDQEDRLLSQTQLRAA
jgi:hypothetical protein